MTVPIARAREAPSAARIASSRARRWTWTSVSPAMLATAMIHKDATAPKTSISPRRELAMRDSLSERTSADQPASVLGNSLASASWIVASSRPRRFQADARAQPPDAVHEPRVAYPHEPGIGLRGQPDVGRCARERAGHHADDRIRTAADDERAPDSRRIALEAPRPEPLADHRRARSILALFLVGEPAAGEGRHRVDIEEARRDTTAFQPFGLCAARVRHVLGIAS